MVFFLWCSVVVFFVDLTTCVGAILLLGAAHCVYGGARCVCGGIQAPLAARARRGTERCSPPDGGRARGARGDAAEFVAGGAARVVKVCVWARRGSFGAHSGAPG